MQSELLEELINILIEKDVITLEESTQMALRARHNSAWGKLANNHPAKRPAPIHGYLPQPTMTITEAPTTVPTDSEITEAVNGR